MLFFAISALEKVAQVPGKVWLNLGLGLLILFVAIYLFKQAAQMNKIWLTIILFVVFMLVGFHWIYSRNEPRFLTPFVDKIAPFFPSAGSYKARQHELPAS